MKYRGKVVQVEKVRAVGKTYELKLRLLDRGVSHKNRFSYCVTHDDPEIEVHHDDASQCLKEAEAELRSRLAVEWKGAIVIYADSGDSTTYYGDGEILFHGGLSFRYALIEVAKRPDGTDIWRTVEKDHGFVRHRAERDGTPDATAVIPDTPENRAKLQVIADGLEKLGANLTLLLGQDRIVKTLQDVRTLQLPAPAPAAPSKRVTRKKKP